MRIVPYTGQKLSGIVDRVWSFQDMRSPSLALVQLDQNKALHLKKRGKDFTMFAGWDYLLLDNPSTKRFPLTTGRIYADAAGLFDLPSSVDEFRKLELRVLPEERTNVPWKDFYIEEGAAIELALGPCRNLDGRDYLDIPLGNFIYESMRSALDRIKGS